MRARCAHAPARRRRGAGARAGDVARRRAAARASRRRRLGTAAIGSFDAGDVRPVRARLRVGGAGARRVRHDVHTRLAARPQPELRTASIPWGFPEFFIISQTALPALLFLPGTQAFRLPIRTAAFAHQPGGVRVVADRIQRARCGIAKAHSWIAAVMALLAIMLFHPMTPSLGGGFAQIAVYFAVMAPLFWAPVFIRTPEHLARILWILLICSGCNAIVGVLQVYDPRFLPAEFSRVISGNEMAMGSVTFIGRERPAPDAASRACSTRRARSRGRRCRPRCSGSIFAVSGIAGVETPAGVHVRDRRAGGDLSQPGPHQPRDDRDDDGHLHRSPPSGRDGPGRASQFGILAGAIVRRRVRHRPGAGRPGDPRSRDDAARRRPDCGLSERARGAAVDHLQRDAVRVPAGRRGRPMGHGGGVLRQLHPPVDAALGGDPVHRLDDRRRRADDRAVLRRADRHRADAVEGRDAAAIPAAQHLRRRGAERQSRDRRADLQLYAVRHADRHPVLVSRRGAARRRGVARVEGA